MAKTLRDLEINEFSIVRGSGAQPANPEAVAFVYKTADGQGDDEGMQKTKEKPSADPVEKKDERGLAQKIGDVLKGYTFQSTTTETFKDDRDMGKSAESGDDEPTQKQAEAESEAKIKGALIAELERRKSFDASITGGDAVSKAVAPLTEAVGTIAKAVEGIGERVAHLEAQPAGSAGVQKSNHIVVKSNALFPGFTKQLMESAGLTPGQKLSKAVISGQVAGWTAGMAHEEADRFLDFVVDESALLKRLRIERMNGRTKDVDKLALGSAVFRKGTPGVDPGDTVSVSNPTAITLTTQEIISIVSVGDDTLEDNIEGDAFVQHLLRMIADAGANELEYAIWFGDTAGGAGAHINDRWDGVDKLARAAGAHVIDAMGDSDRYFPDTAGAKATKLAKALPTKYRMNKERMAMVMHPDLNLDVGDKLASLDSAQAYQNIVDGTVQRLKGYPVTEMALMRRDVTFSHDPGGGAVNYQNGTMVFLLDPRNVIWGVQREIRIEPERQPRKRATDFVITMRADVKIENADAIAIYDHLLINGDVSVVP